MSDTFQKRDLNRPPNRKARLSRWLPVAAIGLVLAVLFDLISRFRFVDGDEGFYLLAAKLVYHGRVLYRDFFFTQMPLVPYLYGAWMQLAGETWNSARLLSALAAAALGCLLYIHVQRLTGSRIAGLFAVVLFTANIYILAWFPIVKTYAVSGLFLFAAYLLLSEFPKKPALLLAGVFLGLTIDTRLYLLAVTPVFILCIIKRGRGTSQQTASFLWFTAGLGLALSPNLYWLLTDPGTYYFNNFGYHGLRSDATLFQSMREKFAIITAVLGVRPYKEGNGFPFGILTVLNILSFTLDRGLTAPRTWPATWIAFLIILVSLTPTPTHFQYFAMAVPFLIPASVLLIWSAPSRVRTIPGLALLALYLLFLPQDLYRYLVSGKNVLGVASTVSPTDWRLSTIVEISREIDKRSTPGELVLSFWPGYIFESSARCVPGFENHSALPITEKLAPDQRRKFNISSDAELETRMAQHNPCLAVLGNQESMGAKGAPYKKMLLGNGYRIVRTIGDTSIYNCR